MVLEEAAQIVGGIYRKDLSFFDIFLGVEKCPEKLTLFPLIILSADDVIFSFAFVHF